ncbi:MAG: hypothetical protein FJX30_05120 [Alphaproteobacteria bacterium]|nr:hypothetical protein [Alphaproteobacteria bacterium]
MNYSKFLLPIILANELLLARSSLSAGAVVANQKCLSDLPFPRLDLNFTGGQIADSQIYTKNGVNYIAKSTGGEVAGIHDEILRELKLVTPDVPKLEKVITNIIPEGAKDDEHLSNIVGQMREKQDVKLLNREDRKNFISSNWQSFVKASMLGVGITDLIYNPNNLVELNNKITVIDVDAMSLPIIPYEISEESFRIGEDKVKAEAKNFFNSPKYDELKNRKLNVIEQCSGKDSNIYRQYVESFAAIDRHITRNEPYYPLDFYFGNIRGVKMDTNGKTKFNANFTPLNEAGSTLEVLGEFSKKFTDPSITPLLCRDDKAQKVEKWVQQQITK